MFMSAAMLSSPYTHRTAFKIRVRGDIMKNDGGGSSGMSRKVKAEIFGTLLGLTVSLLLVLLMTMIFVKLSVVPKTASIPCAMAALCEYLIVWQFLQFGL